MVFVSNKNKFIFIHIPKTGGQTIKTTFKKNIKNDFNRRECNTLYYAILSKDCTIKNNKKIKKIFRSPRHLTLQEINKLYPENYYRFTFIRNPYDRYYSIYNHFKSRMYKFFYIFLSINIILLALFIYSILKKKYIPLVVLLLIILLINIYIGIQMEYYRWMSDLITLDFNSFTKKNIYNLDSSLYGDLYKAQYDYIENNRIDYIGKQENFKEDFNTLLDHFQLDSTIYNNNVRNSNNYESKYKYIHKYKKETIELINKKYDIDFKKLHYPKI